MIISKLNNFKVSTKLLELRKEVIASCLGCFSCWFNTPGICIISDSGRGIPKLLVQSDVVILISPLVFGGYSAELKKALDRGILPFIDPDLMKINGEVHHKQRYSQQFYLIGIGISEDDHEENSKIFKTLVQRNSINMHCKDQLSLVIRSKDTAEEIAFQVESILEKVLGGELTNG